MTEIPYIGSELELFAKATRWKRYFASQLQPFLGREVIEVGAGLGGTTGLLFPMAVEPPRRWLCLEPDVSLMGQLQARISDGQLPSVCEPRLGTLEDLAPEPTADTFLYIDVLEHIEDDQAELERAALRLLPGGHVLVLSPAHPWLFTPFDQAIGHFRRYTRQTLLTAAPAALKPVRVRYLDSVGLSASLANRILLQQSMPTERQILTWDRLMVPCSRLIDPLLGYRLGKSILVAWRKEV